MLSILLTLIVILLIAGLLFAPASWGYSAGRSPIAFFLVVLLVLFLVFHPF